MPLTDTDKQAIVQMYEQGVTVKDIAAKFDVSRQTVYNVLHKTGVTPNHYIRSMAHRIAIKEEYKDTILNMYVEDDKTPGEIAAKLGIPKTSVMSVIRQSPYYATKKKTYRAQKRYREIADAVSNDDKLTYADVADMFGVSIQTVIRAVKYAGLPRRKPGPRPGSRSL